MYIQRRGAATRCLFLFFCYIGRMKRILVLFNLFILSGSVSCLAQETTIEAPLAVPDTLAAYPGGETAFDRYVQSSLQTTRAAREANISGNVVVKFVIDPQGRAENIRVTQKLGYGCDEQAVLLLRRMPAWQPGVINGKRIRTTLERTFHFDNTIPAAATEAQFTRDMLPAAPSAFGSQPQDLEKYLQASFKYPAGIKKTIEDRLVLRFRVMANGTIADVQLVTGLNDALDREAIRVVKSMPAWLPKQAGFKPVDDYRQLAISFKNKKPLLHPL